MAAWPRHASARHRASARGISALAWLLLACAPPAFAETAYLVVIQTHPRVLRAGLPAQLEITVRESAGGSAVRNFQQTHEELFHVYIVSEDLRHFAHEHAHWDARGFLRVDTRFPRAGMYRVLSEYQPAGAEPLFTEGTLLISEESSSAETAAARPSNTPPAASAAQPVLVSLRTEPSPPQPGIKTPLIFSMRPAAGLEQLHGDWAQLLVVSDDLIDMIRAEPAFIYEGQMQFNIYFPRPRRYRLWLEYKHSGTLRRERMDVDVAELR